MVNWEQLPTWIELKKKESRNEKQMRRIMLTFSVITLTVFLTVFAGKDDDKTKWLIVPGVSVGQITPKTSEAELKKIYGEQNVIAYKVPLGEGETEQGTSLFPNDALKKIEILWHDSSKKQHPSRIQITGDKSDWKTVEGVSLGTTLKELEKINTKPFSLAGFGWDYEGTVYSWKDGKLEKQFNTNGRILLRLDKAGGPITPEEGRSVMGDREFSSTNPAMQKINPTVYQMIITFPGDQKRDSN